MKTTSPRLLAVTIAGLALAACAPALPAPPEFGTPRAPAPVPDPPEVRLVAAIETQGCVLTADNVGSILLAANLTQAELVDITPRLAEAGRAEVSGEGAIRVLTDRCV